MGQTISDVDFQYSLKSRQDLVLFCHCRWTFKRHKLLCR